MRWGLGIDQVGTSPRYRAARATPTAARSITANDAPTDDARGARAQQPSAEPTEVKLKSRSRPSSRSTGPPETTSPQTHSACGHTLHHLGGPADSGGLPGMMANRSDSVDHLVGQPDQIDPFRTKLLENSSYVEQPVQDRHGNRPADRRLDQFDAYGDEGLQPARPPDPCRPPQPPAAE